MTLNDVKNALLTVGASVYHYTAFEQSNQYIVWAEDTQADSVWADGRMENQAIQGTIDYYTKTENDAKVKKIQDALNDAGISFRLNSIQYEDDTMYLHYEWIFEVEGF